MPPETRPAQSAGRGVFLASVNELLRKTNKQIRRGRGHAQRFEGAGELSTDCGSELSELRGGEIRSIRSVNRWQRLWRSPARIGGIPAGDYP